MIYEGIAMHHSFANGRKSGKIYIEPNTISFRYEGGEYSFPVKGIEISSGGAGNRIIYIRHHLHPEWCFYSGDKEITKDSVLLETESGKRSASHVKSTNRLLVGVAFSIVAFFLLIVTTLFIFKDKIIYSIANTIPVEWEQKAGESMFEAITQDKKLIKDVSLNKQANKLGSYVSKSVANPAFKFKFYIVEDSTLNAFALPGGNVVIHSGLILQASNAEEVLGVLGHEIAHVTQRHHARGLIGNMGLSFIIKNFLGTDSDLANLIIDAGGTLQSLKYSRDLESEADEKGWEYLVQSDINPNGMISFFKKLEIESNKQLDATEKNLSFLSTHPDTGDRIKGLEKKLDKTLTEQKFVSVPFDFKEFQSKLKAAIK